MDEFSPRIGLIRRKHIQVYESIANVMLRGIAIGNITRLIIVTTCKAWVIPPPYTCALLKMAHILKYGNR
jgi:hypothetical protein